MGLRPGHCYRSTKTERANTRTAVKVHRRNYIGAVPGLKTRQFNMGNPLKHFTHILDLVSDDADVQIRDNSIESARIAINRHLHKLLGKEGYFMKIRVYPHHILRENKQAQGAHADRIQTGMSKAFGKSIGRAARLRAGQKIISVLVDEPNIKIAKEALLRAKSRLTCNILVKVGTDIESIGTKPKKTRVVVEKKKDEEKEEGTEEKEEEKGKEKGKGEKNEEASAKKKDDGKKQDKKK